MKEIKKHSSTGNHDFCFTFNDVHLLGHSAGALKSLV